VVAGRSIEVGRDDGGGAGGGDGGNCVVRIDGREAGRIAVDDALRPDAAAAVAELRGLGLGVTMLSGDARARAETVAASLGIAAGDVRAEATPESKSDLVAGMPDAIMVGDGINDAAALAAASVGVAMASGTNIAIESADVVIPGNQVMAVPHTVRIARQTLSTIKQNLFFAFVYNVVMIPVAALGVLGPSGPLVAAAAMALSDLTVIGNALRLGRSLSNIGHGVSQGVPGGDQGEVPGDGRALGRRTTSDRGDTEPARQPSRTSS